MLLICLLMALLVGHENNHVGDQIRQRMDAIGNQALGFGHHACADLGGTQQEVDGNADPGTARGSERTFAGCLRGGFGVLGCVGGCLNLEHSGRGSAVIRQGLGQSVPILPGKMV